MLIARSGAFIVASPSGAQCLDGIAGHDAPLGLGPFWPAADISRTPLRGGLLMRVGGRALANATAGQATACLPRCSALRRRQARLARFRTCTALRQDPRNTRGFWSAVAEPSGDTAFG
jgi:hypothetical protein